MNNYDDFINALNDHSRLLVCHDQQNNYPLIYQQIIDHYQNQNPNIMIGIYPMELYYQLGANISAMVEQIVQWCHEQTKKHQEVLIIVSGMEILYEKTAFFPNSPNLKFIGITSHFIHHTNHNLMLNLTTKYYWQLADHISSWANKWQWNSPNHLIYQAALNQSQLMLTNYDQLVDWISNHVIQPLMYQCSLVNHKKLNWIIMKHLIQTLAFSQFGQFNIMSFCQQHNYRYETVMLCLNFLIKTHWIYEVKLVLHNDLYSLKKQSLYFFQNYQIYWAYAQLAQTTININNIILSVVLNQYAHYYQFSDLNFSYKKLTKNHHIWQMKLGWYYLQVNSEANEHEAIKFDHELINKLWNVSSEQFTNQTVSYGQFSKLHKLKVDKTSITSKVAISDYFIAWNV